MTEVDDHYEPQNETVPPGNTKDGEPAPPESAVGEHRIEEARSGRSKCKACKRAIAQGQLRLGQFYTSPWYPQGGYAWFHLRCGARKNREVLREAMAKYQGEVEEQAALEQIMLESEQADREKKEQRHPYLEIAKTGRSKCTHSGEMIAQGAFRVVYLRANEFQGIVRYAPANLAAEHALEALADVPDLIVQLRANSFLDPEDLERGLSQVQAAAKQEG